MSRIMYTYALILKVELSFDQLSKSIEDMVCRRMEITLPSRQRALEFVFLWVDRLTKDFSCYITMTLSSVKSGMSTLNLVRNFNSGSKQTLHDSKEPLRKTALM